MGPLPLGKSEHTDMRRTTLALKAVSDRVVRQPRKVDDAMVQGFCVREAWSACVPLRSKKVH